MQQQQLNTMDQQQLHAATDGTGSMADWEVVETYGDMLMDEPAEDGCPAGQGATFLPDTQGTAAATLASAPAAGGVGSQERQQQQQQQQQGHQQAACLASRAAIMTCQASAPASPPRTTVSPSGHAGSGTGMAAAAAGPALTQQALSPTGSPPASPPLPVGSPNACTSHAPYPGATACNNRAFIQPKSRQHGTGSGHWVWVPSGATAPVADPHAVSGAIHTLQQQQPQQQQRQADQVYQLQRQLSQRDYEVMRLRQQLVRQGEELAQLKDQLSKQQDGQHLVAGV